MQKPMAQFRFDKGSDPKAFILGVSERFSPKQVKIGKIFREGNSNWIEVTYETPNQRERLQTLHERCCRG